MMGDKCELHMVAETCDEGKMASWVGGPVFFTWTLDLRGMGFTSGPLSPRLLNKEFYLMAKLTFITKVLWFCVFKN